MGNDISCAAVINELRLPISKCFAWLDRHIFISPKSPCRRASDFSLRKSYQLAPYLLKTVNQSNSHRAREHQLLMRDKVGSYSQRTGNDSFEMLIKFSDDSANYSNSNLAFPDSVLDHNPCVAETPQRPYLSCLPFSVTTLFSRDSDENNIALTNSQAFAVLSKISSARDNEANQERVWQQLVKSSYKRKELTDYFKSRRVRSNNFVDDILKKADLEELLRWRKQLSSFHKNSTPKSINLNEFVFKLKEKLEQALPGKFEKNLPYDFFQENNVSVKFVKIIEGIYNEEESVKEYADIYNFTKKLMLDLDNQEPDDELREIVKNASKNFLHKELASLMVDEFLANSSISVGGGFFIGKISASFPDQNGEWLNKIEKNIYSTLFKVYGLEESFHITIFENLSKEVKDKIKAAISIEKFYADILSENTKPVLHNPNDFCSNSRSRIKKLGGFIYRNTDPNEIYRERIFGMMFRGIVN